MHVQSQDDAVLPQTSAAAVLTPTFDVELQGLEKVRAHSSWAIAGVAVVGFLIFCGMVVYHGIVGEWPTRSVLHADDTGTSPAR